MTLPYDDDSQRRIDKHIIVNCPLSIVHSNQGGNCYAELI